MNTQMRTTNQAACEAPSFWRTRGGTGVFIAAGIAGLVLLKEHWEHAKDYLPYLLFLACPLMHLFMHGNHGGHGNHDHGQRRSNNHNEQLKP